MKKLLALLLVAILCMGIFTACGDDEVEYDVESAANVLAGMYEDYLRETELTKTLTLTSKVTILDVVYDVVWTTDNAKIQITKDEASGTTLVKPCEKEEQKISFQVIGTITDPNNAENSKSVTLRFFIAPLSTQVLVDEKVTEAKANTPYKFYFTNTQDGKDYYFKGGMSGFYIATSDKIEDALDVFVEAVEGGYKLYYVDPSSKAKSYFSIEKSADGNHTNAVFKATAAEAIVLKANAEHNTFVATLADGDYYFGTYSTYKTIGASQLSKISTGYPCHLAKVVDSSTISDADKAAMEKARLDIASKSFVNHATLNLPAVGSIFHNAKITWSIDQTYAAKIENGNLVVGLRSQSATAKLTATITVGSASVTKDFELSFAKKPVYTLTDATPAVGTAYKLYVDQFGLGKKLFITGKPDGNYMGTSELLIDSVDVYLEAADGGFKLYTEKAGAKTYLSIVRSDKYVNAKFVTNASDAVVFTYNATLKTATTDALSPDVYVFGTSATYGTITAKKTTDEGLFALKFATVSCAHDYAGDCDEKCETCGETRTATGTHVDANSDSSCDTCGAMVIAGGTTSTTELEIGKGYTISATNGKGVIYVISTISSGRFQGTYTASEATYFFIEATATAGEYLLYYMDGTTKTYVVFGDASAGASVTTNATDATVFEWNTDKYTLAVADDDNNRAFAVGATSTYDNFSSYDLTGDYNWGIFTAADGTVVDGSGSGNGGSGSGSGDGDGSGSGSGDSGSGDSGSGSSDYASIVDAAYALSSGASLSGTQTLAGVIVSIDESYSSQYKNIVVTIIVTDINKPIQCYRLTVSDKTNADELAKLQALAIGNEITVSGTIKNFNGTIEFDAGCILSAVNNAPALTDDQKVAVARALTNPADSVNAAGTITLPATQSGAAITWSVLANDYATVTSEGLVVSSIPTASTVLKLTATFTSGSVSVSKTYDVLLAPPSSSTLAASLSFASTDNRTSWDANSQVWAANGITVTNNKASSTSNIADYSNPARFYKNSSVQVDYTAMTKIVFKCNNASYATALVGSITESADYSVVANGSDVTVTFNSAVNSFSIAALSGGQVRINSLDVYTG